MVKLMPTNGWKRELAVVVAALGVGTGGGGLISSAEVGQIENRVDGLETDVAVTREKVESIEVDVEEIKKDIDDASETQDEMHRILIRLEERQSHNSRTPRPASGPGP